MLNVLSNIRMIFSKTTIFAAKKQKRMLQKLFFFSIILGFSFQEKVAAHSFHVGIAFVEYEASENRMYATVQLERSDFAHWMEDFSLPYTFSEIITKKNESKHWSAFESFIGKHFSAHTNQGHLSFNLFDIEEEDDGRLFLYLIAEEVEPFREIDWTFSLLMGHSTEQQNKLELKIDEENYFAYFFENEPTQTITLKP